MLKFAPSTRRTMYKEKKLLLKFLPFKREFHKTCNLSVTNDQEILFEKAIRMEEQWDVTDREIEKVTKRIQRDDEGNGDDGEESYLSEYITIREKEKDNLVGELEEARTSAIVQDRDRDARLVFLDIVDKTTQRDIETLEFVQEQLAGHEDGYEEVIRLLEELRVLETNVASLIEEFHANDLPPISSTQNHEEISQDNNNEARSNLDDYADTSAEMPSYMEPED